MKLFDLLKDVKYELVKGSLDVNVEDICYDSRKASDVVAFVAMRGFRVDGHDYIDNAISLGCKVIILDRDINVDGDVTVIKLENTRNDLAKLSRTLFGYPDKEITLIGITGTKGKTTTSTMIKKILDDSGNDCSLIGTMGVFIRDKYYHTMNTSPESYDVFKYMRESLNVGNKYLVMEVSSQSLKLNRWNDIMFDYAVFTNLSLDHVGDDEHESFDDYKYCKSKLFKQCKIGVFNCDSEYYSYMSSDCSGDVYTYGYDLASDYIISDCSNIISSDFIGISMDIDGKVKDSFKVSIPGLFTAYNTMACVSVCNLIGIDMSIIKDTLIDVSVKGRLEPVNISNKFKLLIDYAYQGIAMENVLSTIKESKPKRIVSLFGCGGNRSRQRRYDCGEVSGKYADLSIITADNPRYEDNNDIIKDILVGMNKTDGEYVIVPDRRDAIRYSIENAHDGDVILVLGKGHEDYQEINGVRYPFDERVVIREIVDSKMLSNELQEKLEKVVAEVTEHFKINK